MNFVKRDRNWLILLVIAGILTHILWYEPWSVLTSGDWTYMTKTAVASLWKTSGAWTGLSDLGSVNIQIPFDFFFWIWSLVVHLGGNYDTATKITFFIPISLMLFLSPFVLLRFLNFNAPSSFIGAVFYGSNLYAVSNLPTFQVVYGLAPILLLLFLYALKSKPSSLAKWVLFAIAYSIGISYEVRIMYIVTAILILAAVWLYPHDIVRQYKNILLVSVVILALNSYWLLPTLLGHASTAISAVAGRGLFGTNLFDITSGFALFPWNWTGGVENIDFVKQPVMWFYLLVPIVAFFSLLNLYRESAYRRKIIMFYAIVALIGVFLTKEEGIPFTPVYGWLYTHFPGFVLFRVADNFYLVTAIGYAGLLAATFDGHLLRSFWKSDRWIPMVGCILIVLLGIINYLPAVTGSIGTLFISARESTDYKILNSYLQRQPQYFRTLWVPTISRWGLFSASHPKASIQDLSGGPWSELFKYNTHDPSGQNYISLLTSKYAQEAVSSASVKYIIVPPHALNAKNSLISEYGIPRQSYINTLDRLSWIKRIYIGTKELAIYRVKSFEPHVSIVARSNILLKLTNPGLHFVNLTSPELLQSATINPTKQLVRIEGASSPFLMSFSEDFNSEWKLYLQPIQQKSICITSSTSALSQDSGLANGGKIETCESSLQLLNASDITALTKPAIFTTSHIEIDGYANGWIISPSYIKAHFPSSYYKMNANGSIDLNMAIYYLPQTYWYIGLGASSITLLGCLGYLVASFLKRRRHYMESVRW